VTPQSRVCKFTNCFADYGPTIYASLGLSTKEQLIYQGGFNTLAFGAGIMALFVIDRFSRPLMIAGGTAIVLATLVAEAALVASYPPSAGQNPAGLKAAIAMIYLYIVSTKSSPSVNQSALLTHH